MKPLAFQVGSFDITKYSDNELWARMTAFSRLYSGMEEDFRLLAYSRPYPLEGAVENLRHLMAGTSDPLTRERLAAYRRFIEELVETSSLKTTNYYTLVFSEKAPRIVANTLEGGLRLPVWHRPTLPPLIRTLYREKVLHIHPADDTLDHPLIAFLCSYDLRGNVDFSTPINFLRLPCPLAMAVDVHTIHPNKVMTKLSRAYNALKSDIMGKSGNEAPDAEKEQAFLDVQEAMSLVTNERAGLHQIGVGLAVMGATRDELEENVEMVRSTGTRSQISLRRAFGHQKQAMSFFLPQRVDAAIREEYRNTMSPGIAWHQWLPSSTG